VEFTATGDSVVATSFSAKGLIFDANTGLITRRFRSPSLLLRIDGAISTAAANPVTEQIATGGERGEITLWEKEGDVIYSGAENTPTVEHLSSLGFVHRDGGQAGPHPIFPSFGSLKFEITDDGRGTIRVTDVPTGTVFLNLKHQLENVHEFALDREQNMLVARGGTGHEWDPRKPRTFSYQQWPFVRPLAELVPLAQKRALRCLAPENRVAAELPQDPPAWCVSLNKPPYATVGNKRN
jgi:hypothetical protein